jgi:hypothetical protein
MSENIVTATTWHHRRKIRAAFNEFINTEISSNRPEAMWCDVTLTLKQGMVHGGTYEKLNRDQISKCIEDLMKALNRRIYKKAYRRFGKRLACVPVIEISISDRLHVHMVLEIPAYMSKEHDIFFGIIRTEWQKIRWSYTEAVIRHLPEKENVQGWTKYILKDVSKNDDTLDVNNLYLGSIGH